MKMDIMHCKKCEDANDPVKLRAEIDRLRAEVAAAIAYNNNLQDAIESYRAEVAELRKDAERLNEIASEYYTLESFARPTGGDDADVGWRVLQWHCGKTKPTVVAEVFEDNPRAAIDAALAKDSSHE